MCHRHPNIGWVYRCTQDYGGFLPESDFAIREMQIVETIQKSDDASSRLSPWIVKAIEENQYTLEQIAMLRSQKQKVKSAILGQEDRAATPSDCSRESNLSTDFGSTTSTTTGSTQPDDTSDPPSRVSTCIQESGSNWCDEHLSAKGAGVSNLLPESNKTEPPFPICTWKCCHKCRPTYRDRAYQSLDGIVNNPCKPAPVWELENRRVSDIQIVAKIGLPRLRHIYKSIDGHHYDTSMISGESNMAESESGRVGNMEAKTSRRKSGFRAKVRKAIKGAGSKSRDKSCSRKSSSPNSSQESQKRYGRSMLFLRRTPKQPRSGYGGRVIEDKQLQESLMLMIAINTPLPDAALEVEELEGGEVEVEDGVAVTEEGVGLRVADILMQV